MARLELALKDPSNENSLVYIDKAIPRGIYYCPACKSKVYVCVGIQRSSHFAHFRGTADNRIDKACEAYLNSNEYQSAVQKMTYTDQTDNSQWHNEWQNTFKKLGFEIEHIENNEKMGICRADAFNSSLKRVIEFQHSALAIDIFNRRNRFWNKMGYHITWLFDISDSGAFPSNFIEKFKSLSGRTYYKCPEFEERFDKFYAHEEPNIDIFFWSKWRDGSEWIGKVDFTYDNLDAIDINWIAPRSDLQPFMNAMLQPAMVVPEDEVKTKKEKAAEKRDLRIKSKQQSQKLQQQRINDGSYNSTDINSEVQKRALETVIDCTKQWKEYLKNRAHEFCTDMITTSSTIDVLWENAPAKELEYKYLFISLIKDMQRRYSEILNEIEKEFFNFNFDSTTTLSDVQKSISDICKFPLTPDDVAILENQIAYLYETYYNEIVYTKQAYTSFLLRKIKEQDISCDMLDRKQFNELMDLVHHELSLKTTNIITEKHIMCPFDNVIVERFMAENSII